MIVKLKNNIRKYIRKYIPVLCTLFLIPCISFNAFAAEIVGLSNGNVIRYSTGSPICILVNSNGTAVYNGSGSFNEYAIGSTPLSNYSFDSPSVNASAIWFGHEEFNNNVVVNTELFDYYFIFLVTANNSNFTFVPSSFRVQSYANGTPIVSLTDFSYTSYSDGNAKGFCCIGKMPDVNFSQFAYFNVNGSGVLSEDIYISPFVYVTEKGSETSVESLISAINNQTSELGGKIDDTNDLIENGSSGTQSAITDFNEVFEDFNEELENWEQFDDEIIGEFNSANEDYKAELNNFSLSGSLLNAGNWLSTSMQTVYDNSSDYKMLWLVPLLFGIPILLFIIRKNGDDE